MTAVEWVRVLPARIKGAPNVTLKYLSLDSGKKHLMTLCSLGTTIQPRPEIQLQCARQAAFGGRAIRPDGSSQPLTMTPDGVLRLEEPLECLGVAFVAGERRNA